MKIGFIADVHIGNHRQQAGTYKLSMNRRCQQTIAVLVAAADTALSKGCDQLVVLGDLFDNERPTPQMIAAVMDALKISTTLLVGNHDRTSDAYGDHALGWAYHVQGLGVVNRPTTISFGGMNAVHMVPFQAGNPKKWLPAAIERNVLEFSMKIGIAPQTLCIHLGLRDAKARKTPWAAAAEDAVDVEWLADLCYEHGISHVFAGNWHTWQQHLFSHSFTNKRVTMTQVGALVPTGWDNPGFVGYGGLAIFDGETVERVEIPGPRFIDVIDEEGLEHNLGTFPYVRWTCKPDEVQQAQSTLEDLVELNRIRGYVVRVDDEETRSKARAAACSASDTNTLGGALDAYVGELTMHQDVSRPNVLNLCRKYLGVAGP